MGGEWKEQNQEGVKRAGMNVRNELRLRAEKRQRKTGREVQMEINR